MNYYKNVFLYGFAIFSMVFGAGNLILPMYTKNFKFNKKRRAITRHEHNKKKGKIVSYIQKPHEESISKIATENMPRLTSMFSYTNEEYNYLWKNDVQAALNDEKVISKVYLFEEKPVAFITYTFTTPWYNRFYPCLNAKIYHLAVNNKYQNKEIGTKLLQEALNDCQKKSVCHITLRTTSHELERYYKKFGFKIVQISKVGGTLWKKRLTPHPLILLFNIMYNKIIKK